MDDNYFSSNSVIHNRRRWKVMWTCIFCKAKLDMGYCYNCNEQGDCSDEVYKTFLGGGRVYNVETGMFDKELDSESVEKLQKVLKQIDNET